MSVDLCELKVGLTKRCNTDATKWIIRHGAPRAAYIVTVSEGNMPESVADALRSSGYKNGDSAMVVVQWESALDKGKTEPDAAAKTEAMSDDDGPIGDFSRAVQQFAAVNQEVDAKSNPTTEDRDRVEAARQGVLEAMEALDQENLNWQLRTQKAVLENAAKALTALKTKLPALRAKYKTKLKTTVKYLQEVAVELDRHLTD